MSDDEVSYLSDSSEIEEEELFDLELDEADAPIKFLPEEEFKFRVLKPKDLIESQLSAIEDVNRIFMIPHTTARQLLAYFNWDKERLLEKYYEDPERLFREAHVVSPNRVNKKHQQGGQLRFHCEICYDDFDATQVYGMGCQHTFCRPCWNQYLTTKILDEGMAHNITCPAADCNILVDETTVTELLSDKFVLKKYQYFVAKAFVGASKNIKWCPGPGCENAVKVPFPDTMPVVCLCGTAFCFGCLQPPHSPVKCGMLKKWLKKCADDSETANWIAANTKECPRCQVTIEKNGGCNHMTCRSQTCQYEFCWVCLGPWEPHGSSWYNCNRFDEEAVKLTNDKSSKSRISLERYLHYYNRFSNHEASGRLENNLYDKVEKTMQEMQDRGMSWIEVQFLRSAVDTLTACRATLKYTYVFAFYLKKNNQSVIFEDNQRDLEMATETLSGYLEQEINDDEVATVKQKVLDKSQYCEGRCKVLLDHVNKGYEEGMWEYAIPAENFNE